MIRTVNCGVVQVEKKWPFSRKVISCLGSVFGKMSLLARGKNYLSYDILGGFFGCNLESWNESILKKPERKHFRLKGYKVLFDFLKISQGTLKTEEVCYKFATRRAEISKINLKVYLEFIKSCVLP